jgi:hypothetical protein
MRGSAVFQAQWSGTWAHPASDVLYPESAAARLASPRAFKMEAAGKEGSYRVGVCGA